MQSAPNRSLLSLFPGALIIAATVTVSAQGGVEVFAGIGELIGSFRRAPAVDIGTTRVAVQKLGEKRPRARLQGLSVDPPAGNGWYVAYPLNTDADVVQAVWFVNEPYQRIVPSSADRRTPPRPPVLAARLQFYGKEGDSDFLARFRRAKAREWDAPGVTVIAFQARVVPAAETNCADYDASLIDRRGAGGAQSQAFSLTITGRACRHPGAPWLTIDVDATYRLTEREPRPAANPAWDAFVRSLTVDAFNGPIVEDVLLLGTAERPTADGSNRFWIEDAFLGASGVWVSRRPAGPHTIGAGVLSHIDPLSSRLVAQMPLTGVLRGISGDAVWVTAGGVASRVDASSHTDAPQVQLQCSPREIPYYARLTLTAGDYGLWLACRIPAFVTPDSVSVPGFLRRLDASTGEQVAEIELPRPAREMSGDGHRAWILDVDSETGKRCRLYAIDLDTNRLLRTIELGAFSCRELHATGEEAWLSRTVKKQEEIVKVDLTTGRVAAVVPVASRRRLWDIAIADHVVWASTSPESDFEGTSLGSAGGLMRVDRTTGRAGPFLIPTGAANRIIGVQGTAVWLHDGEGAVLKVRDEP
jgi:hypothetical protein